jgi:hypothetical protein
VRGYILLHRKMGNNPLWLEQKFSRGQAWVDLIMLTNHKPGYIRKRGIKIPINRGECGWSVLALAARWRWSRGKVQRFLDELQDEQQIVQQKSKLTTIIKLVNYEAYQANDTTIRATNGQQTDNKRTQTINDNNDKNKRRGRSAPVVVLTQKQQMEMRPDIIRPDLWRDYMAVRTKLKAVQSEGAINGLINKLVRFKDAGHDPNEAVENSVTNSWKGVFEPKGKKWKPPEGARVQPAEYVPDDPQDSYKPTAEDMAQLRKRIKTAGG